MLLLCSSFIIYIYTVLTILNSKEEQAGLLRLAGLTDAPADSGLKQRPWLLNGGGGGGLEVCDTVLSREQVRLRELLSQSPLQGRHVGLRQEEPHRLLLSAVGGAAQLHRLLFWKHHLLLWSRRVTYGHGLRAILLVYWYHTGLRKEQRGVWGILGYTIAARQWGHLDLTAEQQVGGLVWRRKGAVAEQQGALLRLLLAGRECVC